ncbi:hypothetical protein HUU42_12870 [bacterium]|nr:hypothetical protein [bacterium]
MIIRLITLLLLLGAGEMYAQKIVGSVKVIRDKLQGRNLDIFEGFEAKVLEYVNNYDWAKTGDETPLNVDIQFFLERLQCCPTLQIQTLTGRALIGQSTGHK